MKSKERQEIEAMLSKLSVAQKGRLIIYLRSLRGTADSSTPPASSPVSYTHLTLPTILLV